MHNKNLAKIALDNIQNNIIKFGVKSIKKVTLRIDEEMIKPDIFEKELKEISTNTALENTKWIIEEMKIRAKCNHCGGLFEFSSHQLKAFCPYCHSTRIEKIEKDFFEIVGLVF